MCHQKLTRVRSLLETAEHGADGPNFESVEDSFKDMCNYASFAVSWLRGQIDGQDPTKDIFNRPLKNSTYKYADNKEGLVDEQIREVVSDDNRESQK
jgi:hypothetical protein